MKNLSNMKSLYKAALLAVLGLASVASVQAATYNQDLIVGFTTQSGSDLIYDLGSAASVLGGTAGVNDTWNLSSLLTGNLSTVSADYWGVIGDNKTAQTPAHAVYTTIQTPGSLSGTGQWSPIDTADKTIYGSFATAGAGQYASVATGNSASWNTETISGALTTDYVNAYGNPNTLGVGSIDLMQVLNDGSAKTDVGTFSLSSGGVLSFTPTAVPEPATYGVLAGAGLLVVSLRNQLRRKQA
jgi:hypothetical protein